MPRVAKTKASDAAASTAKKTKGVPKKKQLYEMPEPIKEGAILADHKNRWRVGPSIGMGGFGEIYLACCDGEKTFNSVVKCEPFENGPLFVEMHFYLRNLQRDSIESFKKQNGLKSLGVPHLLGSGSTDINGKKHRFIVMPRYGNDVQKFLNENDGILPEGTVYRLALQMLNVLEFIHSLGYVHGDLKAQNILIGHGKGGASQAYLVDYGLVARLNKGDYKPDPKKMHNGTIEFTSRDAHLGIATKRADLEILGYNLIIWLGGDLPWIKDKLLTTPVKVQQAKEKFMADVSSNLQKIFSSRTPATLKSYMQYVATLKQDSTPDYVKCRNIFTDALKTLKIPTTGDLDFKLKSKGTTKHAAVIDDSSNEEISESEDEAAVNTPIRKRGLSTKTPKSPVARILKTTPKAMSPKKLLKKEETTPVTKSKVPKSSPPQKSSVANGKRTVSPLNSPRQSARTPLAAKTNINIKPAISILSSSKSNTPNRPGHTIINDTLTPPVATRKGNTYEFNFELDVSVDANVIVNVKRKKATKTTSTTISQSSNGSAIETEETSPNTCAKLRKVDNAKNNSVIVPASKLVKSKRK